MLRCYFDGLQDNQRDGLAMWYFYQFSGVPVDKVDTPNESESTVHFHVELKVTEELMACGSWPQTSGNDRHKHFFQFMKENLEQREELPNDGDVIQLEGSPPTRTRRAGTRTAGSNSAPSSLSLSGRRARLASL